MAESPRRRNAARLAAKPGKPGIYPTQPDIDGALPPRFKRAAYSAASLGVARNA